MNKENLSTKLEKNSADDLAEEAIRNPSLLTKILNGIHSSNPRLKFKSAKTLTIISQRDPRKLYPQIDSFLNLLDSKNNILKWNAIDIIARLSSVDPENRFDKVFEKFYSLLSDESMITAGHVIDNSGKIAIAKPELQKKITTELLKIERIPRTQECKNILLGKAILSLDQYFDQVQNKDEIISFVRKQSRNSRNATRIKAEQFLQKHRR